MLRMRAAAMATTGNDMASPWGALGSWDGAMGQQGAWQTQPLRGPPGLMKKSSVSIISGTSSLATTVGPDSATSSLNSSYGDEVDEDHDATSLPTPEAPKQALTTVMVRNIPKEYTREMLMALMNDEGFHCKYDFIYMPIDFTTSDANGYAFVNLITTEEAQRFQDYFQGFTRWGVAVDKTCDVQWSNVLQGLAAHVNRYRSSPLMHEDTPDQCRPAVFSEGVRAPFPPPLKTIRAPRVRRSKAGEQANAHQ